MPKDQIKMISLYKNTIRSMADDGKTRDEIYDQIVVFEKERSDINPSIRYVNVNGYWAPARSNDVYPYIYEVVDVVRNNVVLPGTIKKNDILAFAAVGIFGAIMAAGATYAVVNR